MPAAMMRRPAGRPPGLLMMRHPQAAASPSSLMWAPPCARRRAAGPSTPTPLRAPPATPAAAAARRPPLASPQQQPPRPRRGPRRRRAAAPLLALANGNGNGHNGNDNNGQKKLYDVVGVSNLCVDVVLPVDALPPADPSQRRALLERLTRDPPPTDAWEVGGSCNFMIAAARLGLRVAAVGHTGADAAGRYLEAVLRREGVGPLLQLAPASASGGASVAAAGPAGAAAALAAALAAQDDLLDERDQGPAAAVLAGAAAAAAAASPSPPPSAAAAAAAATAVETLLCFVLVDPSGGHAFCSAYDFGPWPLLMDALEASAAHRRDQEGALAAAAARAPGNGSGQAPPRLAPALGGGGAASSFSPKEEEQEDAAAAQRLLPPAVLDALRSTRALYLNGFVFDELPLSLVRACCRAAAAAGAAVFFDPGPRAHTMREGERRAALDAVMDLADVVLMTEEEAAEVTGCADAAEAARATLARPGCRTRWAVVKRGAEGAVLVEKRTRAGGGGGGGGGDTDDDDGSPYAQYASPAVPVDVRDTVGCGDSFAAAAVLGFTRGRAPTETLALANAVGAATAMGRGAGTNVASAPRVLELLEGRRGAEEGGEDHEAGASSPVAGAIRMLRASLDGGAAGARAAGGGEEGGEESEDAAAAGAVAAAQEAARRAADGEQQRRRPSADHHEQQQQQQQQPRARRRQPTTTSAV